MKKNNKNTQRRIVSAAWKLFNEQGYDQTTVEDIVFESETSKGSFYHYFDGKDALLGSLAYMFDEKYEELMPRIQENMNGMQQLIFLNHELFSMIDSSVPFDLLARLISTQLLARGEKPLMDRNRTYFKVLRQVITEGQKDGSLRNDRSVSELVRMYAMWERSLMYDWCLCGAEYAIVSHTDMMTPGFLTQFFAPKADS